MCTVTLIAQQRGYRLGMNRDELLTRAVAKPPRKKKIRGHIVLGPSEASGGTWITVDDCGVTLALINWYAITARVRGETVSRGEIINSLGALGDAESAHAQFARLPLKQTNPFRLIGVYPASREVVEWRWDLKKLVRKNHPWQTQQWISSGFDEPGAQRERDKIFQAAFRQGSAGTAEWLRRLHRNHSPARGPFSTCMHRKDAASVSYTEVAFAPGRVELRYHAGSPCQKTHSHFLRL
ncbi:MAG TPA: NRDE family protein [Verrucomicrobiae bacterium]|jgi:hypothetical protein|nr:NRDE family protein [Verrucomicrobiae bacterium]